MNNAELNNYSTNSTTLGRLQIAQHWVDYKVTQLLIYVTSVTLIGCVFIIFEKIYGW